MKMDIFVIVLQKIKISVTKILPFLYQADPKGRPFSLLELRVDFSRG